MEHIIADVEHARGQLETVNAPPIGKMANTVSIEVATATQVEEQSDPKRPVVKYAAVTSSRRKQACQQREPGESNRAAITTAPDLIHNQAARAARSGENSVLESSAAMGQVRHYRHRGQRIRWKQMIVVASRTRNDSQLLFRTARQMKNQEARVKQSMLP